MATIFDSTCRWEVGDVFYSVILTGTKFNVETHLIDDITISATHGLRIHEHGGGHGWLPESCHTAEEACAMVSEALEKSEAERSE